MKPGERIRLIKRAAQILGTQSEAEVNLTLGQHGLQTGNIDWYEGDMAAYATDSLGEASDGALADIVEFLEGEEAGHPLTTSAASPWGTNPTRVFISHVHADRNLVGKVKRILETRYGIDAFVAHDDIHPSRTWREQIKIGLDTCDFFAAVVNLKDFHTSQWCDQEVGWALARKVPILPIRPAGFDRSNARDGFLEEHQDDCIPDNHPNPEVWVAHQIFMAVVREPSLREKSVKSLAEALVNSRSYATTRTIWAHLEKQPNIESEQLRRLEYAVQTNNQVYDANVDGTPVSVKVNELVDRFEPPAPTWTDDEPPF